MKKNPLLACLLLVGLVVCAPALTSSPRPAATPLPLSGVAGEGVRAAPTPATPPSSAAAAVLLARADALRDDGDYGGALRLYQEAGTRYPATLEAATALLGMAGLYLEMGQPLSTTVLLTAALDGLPAEPLHHAHFLLAEAWNQLGDCPQAIPLYELYRREGTALQEFVAERLARCYRAQGDRARAAEEFARAAGPNRSPADQVAALEEAAQDLRYLASYDEALARYGQILAIARISWYRAQILYTMGETLQEAGRPREALARWQETLGTYPNTAAAAQAADALLAITTTVDPYLVAQAYRAAGRPDEALPWFEEALQQGAADEARYDLAWARWEAGDLEGALAGLQALAQAHASDPRPLQEQAALLEEAGAGAQALPVYQQLAQRFPGTSAAGEARWRAGQLLEDQGRYDQAVAEYAALLEQIPAHARAAEARFRAGLLRYRQGRFLDATRLWTAKGTDPRLALWRGVALEQLGRPTEAEQAWREAAAGSGYYAARARELLAGGEGFGAFHRWPAWGLEEEARAEAEQWLARRWGRPVSAALPSAVRDDPLFARGEELLDLGYQEEAGRPFSLLLDRFRTDGPALYALSLHLRQHRLYALSLRAASRLVDLVVPDEEDAPPFLLRLLYPTPYPHLIVPYAQFNGVDPLLYFALVRQESGFDRHATSWVGALGLTQVMPSTGEGIAAALGFAPFRLEDLYRPVVSARFGAWYLGRQQVRFAGQALLALAGYNGGPGNANRWAGDVIPVADLDLFVEQVDFTETRDYLERIYTSYWFYRRLYSSSAVSPAH